MATIKLISVSEDEAKINFHEYLEKSHTVYETDVILKKNDHGEWTAEMKFDNMPPQETPEEAIDRMRLYLQALSKAVKGRNIKHLNLDSLFMATHKR